MQIVIIDGRGIQNRNKIDKKALQVIKQRFKNQNQVALTPVGNSHHRSKSSRNIAITGQVIGIPEKFATTRWFS